MSKKSSLAKGLTKILADTFVLYFKTHSFHWNVTGPQFKSLHDLFGLQYTEMWNATDVIAEQIRILGESAPNAFKDILAAASLKENGQTPDAKEMVKRLAADNRAIVEVIYPVLHAAQEAEDEATADILIARVQAHEKAAWMLESSL
ncbi:MAG TPA: DNA starvation/stationary phase protection protein [Alphaproteobacteria bacterium]|nr:DNA starvation/stationary phase protection protein [Alphaproteobacteria bacterium]